MSAPASNEPWQIGDQPLSTPEIRDWVSALRRYAIRHDEALSWLRVLRRAGDPTGKGRLDPARDAGSWQAIALVAR